MDATGESETARLTNVVNWRPSSRCNLAGQRSVIDIVYKSNKYTSFDNINSMGVGGGV